MKDIRIGDCLIGEPHPCFIIAEISANHNHDYDRAVELVTAAHESGADAVKLQTYTADTMTLNCNSKYFQISDGPWRGQTLYSLYQQAYTPWEWHEDLKSHAARLGMPLFSTPFDKTSVDFLESLGVTAYKIASFEIVDIPLLRYVAARKKPIILSTGMASLADIELAIKSIKDKGNNDIILLKCTSDYPTDSQTMNLRTIPALKHTFNTHVGLSDHSLDNMAALASVALGACVIEKHLTLRRTDGGPDSGFSMEPNEFARMVREIRCVESALGIVSFEPTDSERKNLMFRKSLFASQNIAKGELLTENNIRCIRPAFGLHPRYFDDILNKRASCDIAFGTPLTWSHIDKHE